MIELIRNSRVVPVALLSAMLLGVACLGAVRAGASQEEQSLVLELPDKQGVDALEQQGFLVESVAASSTGVRVVVNTIPEERVRLRELGYTWQVLPPSPLDGKQIGYHDYAMVTNALAAFAADYPAITRLETLGQSVQGRELWALLITDHPNTEEDEPEFKYVSTIHGDEPVGTELCMNFIALLLESYGNDVLLTELIDETAIWIVPVMNPDGLESGVRRNAQNYDLNRIFPSYAVDFSGTYFSGEPLHLEQRPPEVQHVMNWTVAESFVLSANLHTGALVVNYPYDDDGVPSGVEAPSPDDALFRALSRAYADLNSPMYESNSFPGGITNGCAWYRITGGMQDWNYRYAGCMEVTLELSNIKRPAASTLDTLWEQNRESMLAYLRGVHWGVRGIVRDRVTELPVWAEILVDGNIQPVFTDPDVGDYHRPLLQGRYDLTVRAPGYIPYRVDNVDVPDRASTRADIPLSTGDVNGDSTVNAADVQYAVNALLDGGNDPMADVDGRGLSATDLQAIINRALRR